MITADYFEGHPNLITLNHSSRRVQEYVREVMLHWPRRAIHGWRLDAALPYRQGFGRRCCPRYERSSPTPGLWGR